MPGVVGAGRRTGKGDHLEKAGMCQKFLHMIGAFLGRPRNNINKHLPVLSAADSCSSVLEERGSDTKDPI